MRSFSGTVLIHVKKGSVNKLFWILLFVFMFVFFMRMNNLESRGAAPWAVKQLGSCQVRCARAALDLRNGAPRAWRHLGSNPIKYARAVLGI